MHAHDAVRWTLVLYTGSADVPLMVVTGALWHASRRDDYHLTCFMTSQPSDPRPDPFEVLTLSLML